MVQRRPRYKPKRSKKPSHKKEICDVEITELGLKGDGLGHDKAGRKFFVPYTVAGDKVRVQTYKETSEGLFAQVQDVLEAGPDRIEPPCPYFAKCGGCALQHLDEPAYQGFKRRILIEQLKRNDCDYPEFETVYVGPKTRRRVSFGVMKIGKRVIFGFNEKASSKLVEIESCLILEPALEKLIMPLRALLGQILKREAKGDVVLTLGDNGIDLHMLYPEWPAMVEQEKLIKFAGENKINRISWQENAKSEIDIIAQFAAVETTLSNVTIQLPPKSFLQPSQTGEAAMSDFVKSVLAGNEKHILDLFAGCGSFTFALTKVGKVHAVEMFEPALKAMEQAAGRQKLGGKITTEVRDLDRQPLDFKELKKYDLIVFDPPRAGALAQAEQLAKSDVKKIIALSCNPATFARDIKVLQDEGFSLKKMALFDQFTWSSHIEVGAFLTR